MQTCVHDKLIETTQKINWTLRFNLRTRREHDNFHVERFIPSDTIQRI